MDAAPDNRFILDAADEPPAPRGAAPSRGLDEDGIARAHDASALAAYCWNVADDSLSWSKNAAGLLQCDLSALGTGRKFADFLDTDNITGRYDTVMASGRREGAPEGVPFSIEYCFRPNGRGAGPALWVEDCGRWFAGGDGRPALVYGTMRVINHRHSRSQEMNFLSNSDELTGMMNRARMLKALDEAIAGARTDKTSCAFAILAVNNLHVMNETYGYEVTDEVIAAIAERLRKVMRMGDAIARYSRAKFGIILNGCASDELSSALERFMRAVRDNVIETPHGPIWALLSIGAVSLPGTADTALSAAACAEESLSEARHGGGDRYVVYAASEDKSARRLLNARCATEIVTCLRQARFKLAFQPVRDVATGEHLFHEALLRMVDTSGELVTAGHLVPVAESLGLIRLIDRAVVQLALATLAAHPSARISINLSSTTLRDPRWNRQILDALAAAPDLTPRLIVEVSEFVAIGESATSGGFVGELHALGCRIAIDGFGAELGSYRSLRELPIAMIKLHGSLCRELAAANGNAVFVRSIVELAHAMNLLVVAEWVETEADATGLAACGIDLLQGNYIGEPSMTVPWKEQAIPSLTLNGPGLEPEPAAQDLPTTSLQPPPAGDVDEGLRRLQELLDNLQAAIAKPAATSVPDHLAIAS